MMPEEMAVWDIVWLLWYNYSKHQTHLSIFIEVLVSHRIEYCGRKVVIYIVSVTGLAPVIGFGWGPVGECTVELNGVELVQKAVPLELL
jgi:hypothetical protein